MQNRAAAAKSREEKQKRRRASEAAQDEEEEEEEESAMDSEAELLMGLAQAPGLRRAQKASGLRPVSATSSMAAAETGATAPPRPFRGHGSTSCDDPIAFHGRRSAVLGTKGMAASTQPLATEAGLRVLRQGGNAVDAAVAMAAALNVTEPCSTGIGGDAFALFFDARARKVKCVLGNGKSPKGLTLEELERRGFCGADGAEWPPYDATTVSVPGTAAAWVDMVEEWGSGALSLAEVLQPAIELAEDGFPVAPITAHFWQKGVPQVGSPTPARQGRVGPPPPPPPGRLTVRLTGARLARRQLLRGGPHAKDLLVRRPDGPDGPVWGAPRPGEVFRNPNLARTFRTLASEGKRGFYEGRVARAVEVRSQRGGGCPGGCPGRLLHPPPAGAGGLPTAHGEPARAAGPVHTPVAPGFPALAAHLTKGPSFPFAGLTRVGTPQAAVQGQGGVLSAEDLRRHRTLFKDPIKAVYRGVEVYQVPPPTHGVAALAALNVLEQAPGAAAADASEADRLHHRIEAMRLGYADALDLVADPDKVNVPVAKMLSKRYAAERAGLIAPDRALTGLTSGPGLKMGPDTVYFSVVDGAGNGCSMIQSNYMGFGTGIVPEGCGFTLQVGGRVGEAGTERGRGLTKRPPPSAEPRPQLRAGPGPPQLPRAGQAPVPHHHPGPRHDPGRAGEGAVPPVCVAPGVGAPARSGPAISDADDGDAGALGGVRRDGRLHAAAGAPAGGVQHGGPRDGPPAGAGRPAVLPGRGGQLHGARHADRGGRRQQHGAAGGGDPVRGGGGARGPGPRREARRRGPGAQRLRPRAGHLPRPRRRALGRQRPPRRRLRDGVLK